MDGTTEGPGVVPEPGHKMIGDPEGGLEGRAPEGTAGPSPAAGKAAAKAATAKPATRFRYEVEYRRTGLGGFTDSIALCQTCVKVVNAVATELSRTGHHGTRRYEHEHPLTVLVLEQSNSGRRYYYFKGEPPNEVVKTVLEMAIDAWTWYRASFGDIYKQVKAILNLQKG